MECTNSLFRLEFQSRKFLVLAPTGNNANEWDKNYLQSADGVKALVFVDRITGLVVVIDLDQVVRFAPDGVIVFLDVTLPFRPTSRILLSHCLNAHFRLC